MKKIAIWLSPFLIASACSGPGTANDKFAELAGFRPDAGLEIRVVENSHFKSDSVAYEVNFKVMGTTNQIRKFCSVVNERFFENSSSKCTDYTGFIKEIGQHVDISAGENYVDLAFMS